MTAPIHRRRRAASTRVDPDDWSWNESWFFSWIDLDGGPAGFFRLGVLPEPAAGRCSGASSTWTARWLGIEESRLAFDDLDLADGRRLRPLGAAVRLAARPPLAGRRASRSTATCPGALRARAGAVLPVVDRPARARDGRRRPDRHAATTTASRRTTASRFEQPLEATGTVVVDGVRHECGPAPTATGRGGRASGGRRSPWATCRRPTVSSTSSAPPGLAGGGLRPRRRRAARTWWSSTVADRLRRRAPHDHARGSSRFEDRRGDALDVDLAPIAPSVAFDMAHTCEPEHWLYCRTLVEARVSGWDGPCRGWFEASRYGIA